MTAESKPKTQKEKYQESLLDPVFVKQEWDGKGVDQLLQWLVDHTNNNPDNRHVITLTVGGNLISGTLISVNAYLDLWAEELSGHFTKDGGADDLMRDTVLQWKTKPDINPGDLPPAQFVHLEGCEVYTSSGAPILEGGVLWRGKISSVDGFNLSKINHVTK
ncbi:gas vesicle accessory protein GvpU [Pseudomonas granadensis]|uniref:gas vesicle accessory protein GvpU n=1 Tax=Pseudomonas granadensis TaxID=1421430 RepID=UPI00300F3FB9